LFREEGYHELVGYLSNALKQTEETIEVLLWDPPRALMNAALPTLLRRLNTNWKVADKDPPAFDNFVRNNPLPEFVPAQLFGDLNLPEVTLRSPPQDRRSLERVDVLPILQAMREFAPGRVSRRFGVLNSYARHWVLPGDLSIVGDQTLELGNIVNRYDEIGSFDRFDANGISQSIRCVRPREMQLVVPERRVADSTNAMLSWNTQICPLVAGTAVDLPSPSRWSTVVTGMEFFVHNLNNPLEVRRFATQSKATINFDNGQTNETTLSFIADRGDDTDSNDVPVGIGFAIDVDGLVVRFAVPEDLADRLPNALQASLNYAG
jgi:hypothetical protein